MICPTGKHKINLIEIIQEWEELFGDDAVLHEDMPIYIALYCEKCKKVVGGIFIEKAVGEKRIKSPAFKNKDVVIPKFKGDKI